MITPRIARNVLRSVGKVMEGMSARHLKLIAQMHCCVCWAEPPVDPHHLMRVAGEGVKGIGRKHKDKWAIPLCHKEHSSGETDSAHGHGDDEAWLATKGIDGRALAASLWAVTGDLVAMERVNFANHQRSMLRRVA